MLKLVFGAVAVITLVGGQMDFQNPMMMPPPPPMMNVPSPMMVPEHCAPYLNQPQSEPEPPSAPSTVCFDTRYFHLLDPQCEIDVMRYLNNPVPNLPTIIISNDLPLTNTPYSHFNYGRDDGDMSSTRKRGAAFGGGGRYGWGGGVTPDGGFTFGPGHGPRVPGQGMSGGGAQSAEGSYAIGAGNGQQGIGIGAGGGGTGIGMGETGTGIGIGRGGPGQGSLNDFSNFRYW